MKRKDIFKTTGRKIMLMSMSIVIGTLITFAWVTEMIFSRTLLDAVDQRLYTHKNMVLREAHITYEEEKVVEVVLPAPLTKELINYVWQREKLVKDSPHLYKGSTTYPQFPKTSKIGSGENMDYERPVTIKDYVWQREKLVKDSPHLYKGSTTYPQFPKTSKIGSGENMDYERPVTIKDSKYYYRGIQFMLDGCKVQLLLNINEEFLFILQLRRALQIAFCILVLGALILAFYLAKWALRPLYEMYQKQARFIQDASHEMRTPLAVIRGKLELLARKNQDSIYEALRPLYEMYQKQARFIQDASHEMRTPLAVIRGKLELLARKNQDSIYEHFDELSGMMSELKGIEKMNKDLLMISKEDMKGVLEVKSLSLRKFLDEIAELYGELAGFREIEFTYQGIQEDVTVNWDQDKMKRCINILLENAIKYSESNGRVMLQAQKQEKGIRLIVSDKGRGIKEEEMPYIFERFYRSNEVRASGMEGSGIGLSLLKSLCYTMGIKIKVESKYQEGSTFILEVPLRMTK